MAGFSRPANMANSVVGLMGWRQTKQPCVGAGFFPPGGLAAAGCSPGRMNPAPTHEGKHIGGHCGGVTGQTPSVGGGVLDAPGTPRHHKPPGPDESGPYEWGENILAGISGLQQTAKSTVERDEGIPPRFAASPPGTMQASSPTEATQTPRRVGADARIRPRGFVAAQGSPGGINPAPPPHLLRTSDETWTKRGGRIQASQKQKDGAP